MDPDPKKRRTTTTTTTADRDSNSQGAAFGVISRGSSDRDSRERINKGDPSTTDDRVTRVSIWKTVED